MKIITYSKIGYNHPSQANWNYYIWKVDLINTDERYAVSYTVKETFGGDSRFRDSVSGNGVPVIETSSVREMPYITGIRTMDNMEQDHFIGKVMDFINKK